MILDLNTMDEPSPLGGSSSSTKQPTRKSTSIPRSVAAPVKRPRLFGLFGGQPAPKVVVPTHDRELEADAVREPLAVETTLKRRIERQAREVVGNRARSIEVKLDGKDAVVQATGVKLFQKRSVRKQLEALPSLSGLHSTIEVDD